MENKHLEQYDGENVKIFDLVKVVTQQILLTI